jgi:hypothetical protein
VNLLIIGHRQLVKEEDKEGLQKEHAGGEKYWDETPGLSSVQIYSNDAWNVWNGPASGDNGAKYAEISDTPEIENLYDWNEYGYTNLKTKKTIKSPLLPEAIKVESIGKDPILLSEITLKVEAPKETDSTDASFTDVPTKISPNDPHNKYTLGGGQSYKGLFPGVEPMTKRKDIVIPVKAGKKITGIYVACGDTHPDKIVNKDGGFGTPGWAKLSIGIQKGTGPITWLTQSENVPPEGLMMTSPNDCSEKTQEDTKVILRATQGTMYVMGYHIGYE